MNFRDLISKKMGRISLPPGISRFKKNLVDKIFSFRLAREPGLLLDPFTRPSIHKAFVYLFIIFFFFSTGSLLALFLQDISFNIPLKKTLTQNHLHLKKDMEILRKTDLFNTGLNKKKAQIPVKETTELKCIESSVSSQLPIKLFSTTVLQNSIKSLASIQIRNKRKPIIIREGDKVENMAQIGKIDRQRILFKNIKSGQCEFIENKKNKIRSKISLNILPPRQGKKKIEESKNKEIVQEENKFFIKKSFKKELLGNISKVLRQARALQIKNPDGSLSFKITEIVPGSIYSKLNIEDGDIIEEIDGNKIENLNQVMSLFGKIDKLEKLKLTIKKDGQSQEFDYQFE